MRLLLRDGAVYALAAIVSRGIAFLLVPLYTRLLAPGDYGAFDLIVTCGLLVNLVVALEVSQGMAREWAGERDPAVRRRMASTALWFTLLVHAVALALGWLASVALASRLLGSEAYAPALRAGWVYVASNAVFLQLQGQFRWELRPRAYAVVSVIYGALTVMLGLALGRSAGLVGVLVGQAAAAAAMALLSAALLRRNLGPVFDPVQLARMLRFSLPLVPAGLAIFASFYLNRLMLNAMTTLDDVGVFSVASRLAGLTTLLIVGLQGALTPLVYVHHAEPGVPAQLARLFEGFVALALLVCLLLSVFSAELVGAVAAPGYAAAATLLPWLAPASLLAQMYIFAPGIAIERKTVWQLGLTSASAALSAILNALLIPAWGPLGAAVATCAAAAVFLGLWLGASQRLYPLPLRWSPIAFSLATYVALVVAAVRLDSVTASAATRLACKGAGVALFAGVMLAVGMVPLRRQPSAHRELRS